MPVSTTIRQFDNTDWQLIEINMLNSLDDYIKKNSITTLSRVTGIKTVTLLGIQKKLDSFTTITYESILYTGFYAWILCCINHCR